MAIEDRLKANFLGSTKIAGANRKILDGNGASPTTMSRASGGTKSGSLTEKGGQTGGAGDGVGRRRPSTGTPGSGTSRTRSSVIKTRKAVLGEGPLGFIERATKRGKAQGGGRRGAGPTGSIPAVGISDTRTAPVLGKPIRIDTIDQIKNERATAPARGTSRKDGRTISARSPEFEALKPGEGSLTSISPEEQDAQVGPRLGGGRRFKKGGFTDLGEFKKGGKTLREISQSGGQRVSPFSQKGIGQLFGSAAELAKLFSSKEFQQRKSKGIQSGAAAKGKRADVKAKADKAKALGTLREQISTSDPENPIIARIDEIIQGEILGGDGADFDIVGKLAGQFDDDQIRTILGIIK